MVWLCTHRLATACECFEVGIHVTVGGVHQDGTGIAAGLYALAQELAKLLVLRLVLAYVLQSLAAGH